MEQLNFKTNTMNICNVYIYVPAGSIYEKPGIFGISHLLEHMLMKQTKTFTTEKLHTKLTEIGGITNAGTTKDLTYYYIRTHVDNYKEAIEIMYSIINEPKFSEEELENEKKIVLEELRQGKDNSENELYQAAKLSVLPKKNELSFPVIGKEEDIKRITVHDLKEYFKRRYSEYVVFIYGDVKHMKQIKALTIKTFGKESMNRSFNFKEENKNPSYFLTLDRGKIIFFPKPDFIQYSTYLTFPTISIYDIKKIIVVNFLRFILASGGLNSILYKKLREKRGLVYSIFTLNDESRGIGLFQINFSTSNNNINYIISLILESLLDLKIRGITEKQLKFWKKGMVNKTKYLFVNGTFKEMWDYNNTFYQLKLDEKTFLKEINSVTNDDVKSVSRNTFNFIKMGIVSSGNYPKNDTDLTTYLDDLRETYQKLSPQ